MIITIYNQEGDWIHLYSDVKFFLHVTKNYLTLTLYFDKFNFQFEKCLHFFSSDKKYFAVFKLGDSSIDIPRLVIDTQQDLSKRIVRIELNFIRNEKNGDYKILLTKPNCETIEVDFTNFFIQGFQNHWDISINCENLKTANRLNKLSQNKTYDLELKDSSTIYGVIKGIQPTKVFLDFDRKLINFDYYKKESD